MSPRPMELVYTLPRILRFTQLSESGPPIITPTKEAMAMVMVEMGPAWSMGTFSLSWNSVGSQFLAPHPGIEADAK